MDSPVPENIIAALLGSKKIQPCLNWFYLPMERLETYSLQGAIFSEGPQELLCSEANVAQKLF